MQMRPGDPPGAARERQHIAATHHRSLFDFEFRQMKIHRVQAAAMVDDHTAAGEEKIAHQHHPAMIGGDDFRARRRRQVRAGMRRPRHAVDNAPRTERGRRSFLGHRPHERQIPEPFHRRSGEGIGEGRLFATNLGERLRAHLIEARRAR